MNGRGTQRLAPDELWASDGHASEIVLCAMGDGEHGLVPCEVRGHVFACEVCQGRLADAALASLATTEALTSLESSAAQLRAIHRPTPSAPRYAIPVALALGLLGSAPRLLELRELIGELPSSVPELFALLIRVILILFRSTPREGSLTVSVIWGFAALVLLVQVGLILRLLPAKAAVREEQ